MEGNKVLGSEVGAPVSLPLMFIVNSYVDWGNGHMAVLFVYRV